MKPVTFCMTALLMVCPVLLSANASDDTTPRPNIILVMADDQGYGDVGYMGNDVIKTPVMDEMARSGLRFNRFYAAAPVCTPTRASVLTGRHPNRSGALAWGHHMHPNEVTVAEALKSAGYMTGHFGKWHVGTVDRFGESSPGKSGFDAYASAPNFFDLNPYLSVNGNAKQFQGEGSMIITDAAIEFIAAAQKQDKPFLAVIWYGNPHSPHRTIEQLAAEYPDLDEKQRNYLAEITGIDQSLGKLRAKLRELGIADNTILWYTSDNGPRPIGSTAGLRGWKGTLWEGGIRVPTLIEWPAQIKQPRQTDVPSFTSDIYPTLCELAGVKMSQQVKPLDGVSLVPMLRGETMQRDKAMGFWQYPTGGRPVWSDRLLKELAEKQAAGDADARQPLGKLNAPQQLNPAAGHATWIDGDWKLDRIANKQGGATKIELYNLKTDPDESANVAADNAEHVERMQSELDQWLASVVKSYEGGDY